MHVLYITSRLKSNVKMKTMQLTYGQKSSHEKLEITQDEEVVKTK